MENTEISSGPEECRNLIDDLHRLCTPIVREYEDAEIMTALTIYFASVIAAITPIKIEHHQDFVKEVNIQMLSLVMKYAQK